MNWTSHEMDDHSLYTLATLDRYYEQVKVKLFFLFFTVDCSQPSISSCFYSIVKRADKIARGLDASVKHRGPRKITEGWKVR